MRAGPGVFMESRLFSAAVQEPPEVITTHDIACEIRTGPTPSDPASLRCMEIWGGNDAMDSGVSVPGLDAWVYARPYAGERAGGDLHYISTCGSGRYSRIAVADVAGHGSGVESLARALRGLMRRHINTPDLTRFMRSLNEEFSLASPDGRFATAVLATYHAPTDHLILCNAGHPRPLWRDGVTGRWRLLDASSDEKAEKVGNLPLGVIEPTRYEQFAVPLAQDDLVILYTDALSEARDAQGRMLGEAGLLALAASLDNADPRGAAAALVGLVEVWQGSPLDDDITVLALRHNGANPEKPGLRDALTFMAKMAGLMKV